MAKQCKSIEFHRFLLILVPPTHPTSKPMQTFGIRWFCMMPGSPAAHPPLQNHANATCWKPLQLFGKSLEIIRRPLRVLGKPVETPLRAILEPLQTCGKHKPSYLSFGLGALTTFDDFPSHFLLTKMQPVENHCNHLGNQGKSFEDHCTLLENHWKHYWESF